MKERPVETYRVSSLLCQVYVLGTCVCFKPIKENIHNHIAQNLKLSTQWSKRATLPCKYQENNVVRLFKKMCQNKTN